MKRLARIMVFITNILWDNGIARYFIFKFHHGEVAEHNGNIAPQNTKTDASGL
jgi:hypothetical protein